MKVSRDVSWYWVPLSLVIVVTVFANIAVNMGPEMGKQKLKEIIGFECTVIEPFKYWQVSTDFMTVFLLHGFQ